MNMFSNISLISNTFYSLKSFVLVLQFMTQSHIAAATLSVCVLTAVYWHLVVWMVHQNAPKKQKERTRQVSSEKEILKEIVTDRRFDVRR